MNKIKAIAFTVYPVRDLEEGRRFYEDVLRLEAGGLSQPIWHEYDVGGGTFAISTIEPLQEGGPGSGVAFEVDDIDGWYEDLQGKEVKFVTEMMDFPTCKMFVVKDPFDNDVTLHEIKE